MLTPGENYVRILIIRLGGWLVGQTMHISHIKMRVRTTLDAPGGAGMMEYGRLFAARTLDGI